jgi:hypothetical protein
MLAVAGAGQVLAVYEPTSCAETTEDYPSEKATGPKLNAAAP